MNKNTSIIAILVVVLIAGGVYFLTSNKSSNNTNNPSNQTNNSNNSSTFTPSDSSGKLEGDTRFFNVEGGSYFFKPNEIRVKKGEKVRITFTSKERMQHDFVIDEFNVETSTVSGGDTDTVEFTPDKTGTFEYYCGVANHRQQGQVGKLIVE